ncbi:PEP-CTERM sorting domain-containing protein [Vibrio ulleungensis]|uniref:PEP-CTERM sorting domain-containing protein n=1 Tax=Vibrio ulleungensis TaxID=2807619 RepID=A0ABS2HF72_9VIBR|nr:PEP-CTERM sorting domain-containing protein [Vibrio ulleungensis]MBM7034987.1 PEP-CTERM sorting domain-containing protein [Vibrio ulleungensis]
MRQLFILCVVMLLPFTSQATPILAGDTATILMVGDSRPDNPNNVFAELRLEALSTTEIQFTFDLLDSFESEDAGLTPPYYHSGAKLDAFYFNLDGELSQFSFSDFQPAGWLMNELDSPTCTVGGTAKGSGKACFAFEADKPNPGNAVEDVTVSTDLIFTVTKDSAWVIEDFTDAPLGVSNDDAAGPGGIFGAHVQALDLSCNVITSFDDDQDSDCSDSAFIYGGGLEFTTVSIDPDPDPISEPAHLALFSLALIGMGVGVRRRRQQ